MNVWVACVRVLLIAGWLLALVCLSHGSDLKIAENGKSDYVMLMPAAPSPAEELAAQELSKYLEHMSKARLRIQKGGALPPRAIVVCERTKLDDLAGPSVQVNVTGDAYAIAPNGSRLFLVGGRGRSTLYAVYSFLDRLGCRWLTPKLAHYRGAAEMVPKKKTLVFPAREKILTKPALAFRKLYVEEGHSHNAENLAQIAEWMAKVGYNTFVVPLNYQGRGRVMWDNWREKITPELERRDIFIEVGGHGYQNFLNADMEGGKLFAEHPEWFGQDKRGQRRKEMAYVFCTSNRDAVKFLTANFLTLPAQGVSTYAEPGDWFAYELNHYVLAHLAWNPSTDVDTLIKKFCEARYGPAAPAAIRAFGVLEKVVRKACSIPFTSLKNLEELSRAEAQMRQAVDGITAMLSEAKDTAVHRSLSRLLRMFEYARADLAIQKARAAKAPPAEIRKRAEELHAFLSRHADEGVFLMHDHRLSLARLLSHYGIKD